MPIAALASRADSVQPQRLAGRQNLVQLVELRWLAVGGQLLTIVFVHFALGVKLPLAEMLTLLALLALANLGSWLRAALAQPVSELELFSTLLLDVVVLAGQLYFSGGITNPFVFLFLLQVAVASVLLQPHHVWAMVTATSLAVCLLVFWHRPMELPGVGAMPLARDYVGGLIACFLLVASLLAVFIGRIHANLRQRDASLARLQQRAAEEEHIVRMGLLASGAAHELGTPLATLSVILGDWARMAPFAAEPELREEIEEMQGQIERCKAIVSGILMSAGEPRAEAPEQTTLHEFLDGLAEHWRRTRGCDRLAYTRHELPDLPIIADPALRQTLDNVLDNALEAAPQGPIELDLRCEDQQLVLRVRDHGPGFAPDILEHLGEPYHSTKAEPGHGLGLFLAFNVARTLGGQVQADNAPDGGARVTIELPLAALAPPDEPNA